MILGSCPLPPIVATPWGTSSEAHSSRRLRTEHQHMFPDRRAKYARLVSSAISWTKARESKRLLRLDTSTLYAPASLPPTVSGLRPAPALRSGARTLRASYRVGTIYLERVSVSAQFLPPSQTRTVRIIRRHYNSHQCPFRYTASGPCAPRWHMLTRLGISLA